MSSKEFKKAARIILVGAPGVGKGTQAERLIKRFPQLSAISSGDLLRESVRNRTPIGTIDLSLLSVPRYFFFPNEVLPEGEKDRLNHCTV